MSLSELEISTAWIDSCARGDRDALRALYEAYKDRVYSIAFHFYSGDSTAAVEATQQVFLKLMTSIAKFRGESDFATWLYRLVVNVCLDDVRRNRARKETPRDQLPELGQPQSQEEDLARDQVAHAVRTAVSSLPPKLRLAILLRYFDELSYGQMAGMLSCSAGTVASRLSRGHRLLAEKLERFRGWEVTGKR